MTKQEAIRPADDSGLVRKEAYFKPDYIELEKERLWPRAWQMACRVEELAKVGDYVTYDIADESVILIRSAPDRLNAFYNVCRHRGRRLTRGCGTAERLRCPFHGWQWEIDGRNAAVTRREEWLGLLDDTDLSLKSLKCETWGGFVFVNFDPESEPLEAYLGEAAKILAPFELEKMRFRWRKWLIMPCNWKIALEAFNEGYHVAVTHSQLSRYVPVGHHVSATYGRHGMFGGEGASRGTLSAEKMRDYAKGDARQKLAGFYSYLKGALDSNMTDTIVRAANRLAAAPPEAAPAQVGAEIMRMAMEEDAANGVQWPAITPEEHRLAGVDWHIFPNMILLPMATNCLGYRSRPNGDDPNTCIFEVYQLERFAEGQEPTPVENLRNDDIYDDAFWGEILLQDFQQMEGTHRGVKSKSFDGPLLNPTQEKPISNFHRVYHEFISRP
jgi:phenylpropionate dioxygenase-like ring-hydroxylating dioxygenase large terminal subunit